MPRIRTDLYLFVVLALVGVALTAALLFLPDHRKVDTEDVPVPVGIPVAEG